MAQTENIFKLRRSVNCGDLRSSDIGKEVILNGWAQTTRDHGGLIFVDLRDRSGLAQLTFDPAVSSVAHETAQSIRSEFVLAVKGIVKPRPEGTVNTKLPTGEVEVHITELEILNISKTPPFAINDDSAAEVDENVRLKYRYLDLRNKRMLDNLTLRHKAANAARNYLDSVGFLEVETPLLMKSTPEGARDFLVPSRLKPGEFYALPQSPQLLKQTLMVAGIERYYQFAKCLRDEDLRGDRQFEFTQIDLEMSFVTAEDIYEVTEGIVKAMMDVIGVDIPTPFIRMSYKESMERFGSDKPDTRFGLEFVDLTSVFANTEFKAFAGVLDNGGIIKGINAKGAAGLSRRELDELIAFAQKFGAKGMAYFQVTEEGLKSPVTKFLSEKELDEFTKAMDAEVGDLLLTIADSYDITLNSLGRVRLNLGEKLGLIDENKWNFLWIVDFPMFEINEETGAMDAKHNPFAMPKAEDLAKIDTAPLEVLGDIYDLVLNGNELLSGSVRIHRRDILEKVLQTINMSLETMNDKFGFLMDAFDYGAPPHAGMAIGFDRLIMLMAGESTIRDVIAFPKVSSGADLMMGSPTFVDDIQMRDLGLTVKKKPIANDTK